MPTRRLWYKFPIRLAHPLPSEIRSEGYLLDDAEHLTSWMIVHANVTDTAETVAKFVKEKTIHLFAPHTILSGEYKSLQCWWRWQSYLRLGCSLENVADIYQCIRPALNKWLWQSRTVSLMLLSVVRRNSSSQCQANCKGIIYAP